VGGRGQTHPSNGGWQQPYPQLGREIGEPRSYEKLPFHQQQPSEVGQLIPNQNPNQNRGYDQYYRQPHERQPNVDPRVHINSNVNQPAHRPLQRENIIDSHIQLGQDSGPGKFFVPEDRQKEMKYARQRAMGEELRLQMEEQKRKKAAAIALEKKQEAEDAARLEKQRKEIQLQYEEEAKQAQKKKMIAHQNALKQQADEARRRKEEEKRKEKENEMKEEERIKREIEEQQRVEGKLPLSSNPDFRPGGSRPEVGMGRGQNPFNQMVPMAGSGPETAEGGINSRLSFPPGNAHPPINNSPPQPNLGQLPVSNSNPRGMDGPHNQGNGFSQPRQPHNVDKGIGVQTLRRELLSENKKLHDALMRQEEMMKEMRLQAQNAQSNQIHAQEELDKLKHAMEAKEKQLAQQQQHEVQLTRAKAAEKQSDELQRMQQNLHEHQDIRARREGTDQALSEKGGTSLKEGGNGVKVESRMGDLGRYVLESSSGEPSYVANNSPGPYDQIETSGSRMRYVSTYNNDNVDLSKFDLSKSKELGLVIPSNTGVLQRKMPETPVDKGQRQNLSGEKPTKERPLDDTLAFESRLIYPDGHATEIVVSKREDSRNTPPHSPISSKAAHNPMGPPREQQNAAPCNSNSRDGSEVVQASTTVGSGSQNFEMKATFGEQTQELITAMKGDTVNTMRDTSPNAEKSLDIDALYQINMSKLKDLQDFEDMTLNTDRLDDFVSQFQKNLDGTQEGDLREVSLNTDTRWVVKA